MPSYSYVCECGEAFPAFRAIEDRAHCECPVCGKVAPRVWKPGPTARPMEVIDGGNLAKRIERDAQVERMMYERRVHSEAVGSGYTSEERDRRIS